MCWSCTAEPALLVPAFSLISQHLGHCSTDGANACPELPFPTSPALSCSNISLLKHSCVCPLSSHLRNGEKSCAEVYWGRILSTLMSHARLGWSEIRVCGSGHPSNAHRGCFSPKGTVMHRNIILVAGFCWRAAKPSPNLCCLYEISPGIPQVFPTVLQDPIPGLRLLQGWQQFLIILSLPVFIPFFQLKMELIFHLLPK